jgi:hypothetical protein
MPQQANPKIPQTLNTKNNPTLKMPRDKHFASEPFSTFRLYDSFFSIHAVLRSLPGGTLHAA